MGYHWRGAYNKVLLIHEETEQGEIDLGLKADKVPVFTWRDTSKSWYNQYHMTLQHQPRKGTDKCYWYAFRTINQKTYSAYVGKKITVERLKTAWLKIEEKAVK